MRVGRRSCSGAVALVLATAVVIALPTSSHAKELAAACPVLVRMLDEADLAIQLARADRDRGSALSAQQTLRTTTRHLLETAQNERCGAIANVLRVGLAHADAAQDAVAATLFFDLGFAAMRSLSFVGIVADDLGAKWISMSETAQLGNDCPDLYRIVLRLDGSAHADLKHATTAVLADLTAHPRCKTLTQELGAALTRGTPADLSSAIDNVRLDDTAETPENPSWGHRCPELPMVVDTIRAAIQLGAPLYNQGDHRACRDQYQQTAQALLERIIPAGRCPIARSVLERGVAESAGSASVNDAAWSLRRRFDQVINQDSELRDESPPAPGPGTQGRQQRVQAGARDLDLRLTDALFLRPVLHADRRERDATTARPRQITEQ